MSSLDQAFIRAYAKDRREVTSDPKVNAPTGQQAPQPIAQQSITQQPITQQPSRVSGAATTPMTQEELAQWYRIDAPQNMASAHAAIPAAASGQNSHASKSSVVGNSVSQAGQSHRAIVAARRVEQRGIEQRGIEPTFTAQENALPSVPKPIAERPMAENLVARHASHRLPPYPHLHEIDDDADMETPLTSNPSVSTRKSPTASGNQNPSGSTFASPNDPPYTFVADTATSLHSAINPSAPENLHGRRQTLASYLASQQALVASSTAESKPQAAEKVAAEASKFTAVRPPHSHAAVPAPHFLAPTGSGQNAAVVGAAAKPTASNTTSAKKPIGESAQRSSSKITQAADASLGSVMMVDTVDWTKQPFTNASQAAIVNHWSPLEIGVNSGPTFAGVATNSQSPTISTPSPRASSATEDRKLDSHRNSRVGSGAVPPKDQDGPEVLRGPHQRSFSRSAFEPIAKGAGISIGSEKSIGVVKDKGIDRVDLPAQESKPKTAPIEPLEPFQAVWEVDRLAWPEVCESLMEQQKTAFDAIGRHLQQSCREGLKVLAVTSPTRGEGRSTIAACLARSAAQRNLKVALVDGDMLHPSLSEHLNLEISRGWLDVIYGNLPLEEVAVSSLEDHLTLIPLMDAIEDSSLLPTDARISQMLHELRAAFDLVVVDASHVHTVGGLMIGTGSAGGVDAAIVVNNLRNHDTARIEASVRRIRRMGIASVGIVENFVDA